jgi:hypothetical protein
VDRNTATTSFRSHFNIYEGEVIAEVVAKDGATCHNNSFHSDKNIFQQQSILNAAAVGNNAVAEEVAVV